MGFLGMWICGGLFYYALKFTTAATATLIYASTALMIVILDRIILKRPISPAELIGVLTGLVGVAYVVFDGDLSRIWAMQFGFGETLVVVCAFAWALYSIVLRTGGFEGESDLLLFTATVGVGTVILAPFAVVETLVLGQFPTMASQWVSLLAVAVVASLIPFSIFQYGVRAVGPSLTGVFLYLQPVYGFTMAIILLGEQLQMFHFIGAVIVMGGVILATAPRPGRWRRGAAEPAD
jgi:drug/metabolite transporter (DMT)-like permease